MDAKEQFTDVVVISGGPLPGAQARNHNSLKAWIFLVATAISLVVTGLWYEAVLPNFPLWNWTKNVQEHQDALTRTYNLEIGARWMSLDGGRWRVMFVCNGQTPCPTLYAEEGDVVELTVQNDIYAQSSIHWSGIGYHKTGAWNDGTAGLSQFPTLPRGNWTNTYDTTGSWGLNWYIDHTSSASVDGIYGLTYVAPSPSRPRPYEMITKDPTELRQIREAERDIRHVAIQNHQHRDTVWKLLRMKAEGSEFYCYDSFLVNGKGRVHCRQPGFDILNGQKLDQTGCIQPPGLPDETCSPSNADYEVIETHGRRYIMMNLINLGFEHSVKVSIDGHKMIAVANNGGFVIPEATDVVYIPSATRITVLVLLDAEPADYAIRISSTSQMQNLHGYSILRYPAKRLPRYGEPMVIPNPASPSDVCLFVDGSTRSECRTIEGQFIPPYPPHPPPSASKNHLGRAHYTFRLSAGTQPSLTVPKVPEFFLNEKPWQLFHASMLPLLFHQLNSSHELEKPIIGPLEIGSVVDLIIENQINDTIPLYKHGEPGWLIGSRAGERFPHGTIEDALLASDGPHESLNLRDPSLVIAHDLPPLGWSVLRSQVTSKSATMFHAAKLRYFALGMSVPILEGVTAEDPVQVPTEVLTRPHIDFEPKNDGVFG